eukprot:gene12898-biopygen1953
MGQVGMPRGRFQMGRVGNGRAGTGMPATPLCGTPTASGITGDRGKGSADTAYCTTGFGHAAFRKAPASVPGTSRGSPLGCPWKVDGSTQFASRMSFARTTAPLFDLNSNRYAGYSPQ